MAKVDGLPLGRSTSPGASGLEDDSGASPDETTTEVTGARKWLGSAAVRNVLTAAVIAVAIAAVVWVFAGGDSAATSQKVSLSVQGSGPGPKIGSPAPDFRLTGLDGKVMQLSELRGKPVWITFWATWCPPCRAENPDIQAVYAANQAGGLEIVAINLGEDPSTVRGYAERTGLTFPIAIDTTDEVAASYRLVGIPTHYFVDANGILRDWRIGSMSKKTMEDKVSKILAPAAQVKDK